MVCVPKESFFALALFALAPASGFAQQAPAARQNPPNFEQLSASLRSIADRVSPSLVQIMTSGSAAVNPRGEVATQHGTGSGVVVDPAGFIITNAHVVSGAERVRVRLPVPTEEGVQWTSILKPQGKTVLAQVVGVDPESDLAVLKIEQTGLKALEFGDSERLRQGDIVLALGSPLGLENSVSMGVVSSVARQLRAEDPMIYIQTDATINPGNSGGPLVNIDGRLVGINTLILSQSGGSEGLGFAAPSNIVRTIFEQLRKNGRVRRGYIGARTQTITPALAAGLRLPKSWGVILGDVTPRGPGHTAGLEIGDIVLKLDGKQIENARQLNVNLYQRSVGDVVTLEVLRGSEQLSRTVTIGERPDDPYRFSGMVTRENNLVAKLGVFALNVDEKLASLLPVLRKPAGVVVAARAVGVSEASDALIPGDLICALNGAPVRDVSSLRSVVEKLNSGDPAVVQVQRMGQLIYLALEID